MKKRIKDFYIDVLFGIHSNIPVCCVLSYSFSYFFKPKQPGLGLERAEKRFPEATNALWEEDVSYVTCDRCFSKKRARKLHLCTSKCKGVWKNES